MNFDQLCLNLYSKDEDSHVHIENFYASVNGDEKHVVLIKINYNDLTKHILWAADTEEEAISGAKHEAIYFMRILTNDLYK